jgi:periplasmic divalent cation tolerance protein
MILILTTFENAEDAEKCANHLIDQKLAACVEIYPVKSFYVWKGKKMNGVSEVSAVIKTEDGYFEKVRSAIEQLLPYEIPQIIEIKTGEVNQPYIKWLKEALD